MHQLRSWIGARLGALGALGCCAAGLLVRGGPAEAADPEEPVEEVVVYGDDFARWDHTRWLVLNELWFPFGARFATDVNKQFDSFAFQLRTVLLCDKDAKLSKKRWEVSCEIEDIGISATSMRHWRKDRDRETVQQVLDEIDAKLTGLKIQMQVASDGGVMNFDLEGVVANNSRQIEIQETLRQVLSRMMAGFHLRIPDHAQRSGVWLEMHSELMDLPSLTASRGMTVLKHQVSPVQGVQIIQTVGEGTVSVAIPVRSQDAFLAGSRDSGQDLSMDKTPGASAGGELSEESSDAPASSSPTGTRRESSVDATYKLEATGVAVFQKDNGIMTERVWTVFGKPTASSGGGTTAQPPPYRNVGRIEQLGPNDRPDVGKTEQVAWPGQVMPGLPPWTSIELGADEE